MVSKPMTNQEVLQWASCFLENFPKEESEQLARQLLLHLSGWTWSDLLLHLRETSHMTKEQLLPYLVRLQQKEPLQYVVGHCEFYGRDFLVTRDTLIPRPETEELVSHCISWLKKQPSQSVLEIGVGTGCIIETLALEMSTHEFVGVDISRDALAVAKENASRLSVTNVQLLESDVWSQVPQNKYLAVVSNPPYISEDERTEMDESVLVYEPAIALFAEEKGLAIYKRIAQRLEEFLMPEGRAYFEIGYRQGEAVQQLFQMYCPSREVEILKDLSGMDRIVIVTEKRIV